MVEIHTTGHPQEASQAENGNEKFIPMYVKLGNGEGVYINVPIALRLRENPASLLPQTPPLEEGLMVKAERTYLEDSLRGYLDLVFASNPDTRDEYAELVERGEGNLVYAKGDFVYIYEMGKRTTGFSRMTADSSGTVLTQAVETDSHEATAGTVISQGKDLTKVKAMGFVGTRSAIDFTRDVVLSDLNPVAPKF